MKQPIVYLLAIALGILSANAAPVDTNSAESIISTPHCTTNGTFCFQSLQLTGTLQGGYEGQIYHCARYNARPRFVEYCHFGCNSKIDDPGTDTCDYAPCCDSSCLEAVGYYCDMDCCSRKRK
ncbi:hypothetical protein BC937DRAFT_88418 [Endogone sp. FLAS-F59071]|nr:hypothetical protein BC937DRAFT_88418 [Endogone sp. FLAS-F59071]|eukprot:RUS18714.1 hypothetical protein BC937DRAFT_88418 [Endogone sp. FLAS-F59071]